MSPSGKYLAFAGLVAAFAAVVGCHTSVRFVQPISPAPAASPAPQAHAAAPAPADSPALFGDNPESESVPFENRLVTNLRRHSYTTDGLDFDPDVFGPDNLIAFASTRNSDHPDIFLKNTAGTALTQLTSDPADDIQPRFSPNGRQVTFCSNRTGSWDIWLANRDGTSLTQLTADHTDEISPCWSPDGSQLAYTVWGQRSRQWEVWTLSIDQPGTTRFLCYGMFPAWSPDGGQLVFQRARQRGSRLFSIWTIELVAGEARRPTEVAQSDTAACIAPRWSPDGRMVVYCVVDPETAAPAPASATPRTADLWVVELQTGLRFKLTDGADACFNPVWATNGRIFFVSPRAGTENIWSLTSELGSYETAASVSRRAMQRDSDTN